MFKSKIKLYYNNNYKWYTKEDIYVIGYIYYLGTIYEGKNVIDFLIKNNFRKKYKKIINEFDGCFSIVIKEKNKIIIISDMMRCFPVFYHNDNNTVYVYDNIDDFANKKLSKLNEKEIFSCNYVTSYETIYEDIYQLESHQIVSITDKTIDRYYYYQLEFNKNNNPSFEELDQIYDESIKDVIKYANGRKIIIPLSGGNDSRLLAYYLKQNKYTNVLCYTYGNIKNNELDISKKVADYLEFPWVFINYKNKSMQAKYYNKEEYKKMADYCARGFSEPMIQEWEAIDYLLKNKMIDNNCVIMPGYTNDVLCGSHIYPAFFSKDKYSYEELVGFIREYHYIRNTLTLSELKQKVAQTLNINNYDDKMFTRDETIEYVERFDFKERQVKFITNAIRVYDMNNLSWVLPFWNNKVIKFWHAVSINNRYELKFFNEFTNYKYKELMEKAPIYKGKTHESYLEKVKRVLTKNGSLNLFGYFKYRDYLKYILKYRIYHYNCFFAADYIKYIERNIK